MGEILLIKKYLLSLLYTRGENLVFLINLTNLTSAASCKSLTLAAIFFILISVIISLPRLVARCLLLRLVACGVLYCSAGRKSTSNPSYAARKGSGRLLSSSA